MGLQCILTWVLNWSQKCSFMGLQYLGVALFTTVPFYSFTVQPNLDVALVTKMLFHGFTV